MNEAEHSTKPVILFDGVCNLCNRFVQFVIRYDNKQKFLFSSLQSGYVAELAKKIPGPVTSPKTIILLEGSRFYMRSSAVLRIARQLIFPWNLFYVFMFVPRLLRDSMYNLIARNRYRLFGKRETCMIPTPELRERFLE